MHCSCPARTPFTTHLRWALSPGRRSHCGCGRLADVSLAPPNTHTCAIHPHVCACWCLLYIVFCFRSRYDSAAFLDDYVQFMTTPGSHNDTYAESFHRDFFKNWAAGVPPEKCSEVRGLAHVCMWGGGGRGNTEGVVTKSSRQRLLPTIGRQGCHQRIAHRYGRAQARACVWRGCVWREGWPGGGGVTKNYHRETFPQHWAAGVPPDKCSQVAPGTQGCVCGGGGVQVGQNCKVFASMHQSCLGHECGFGIVDKGGAEWNAQR
jgi:hypothetical protein